MKFSVAVSLLALAGASPTIAQDANDKKEALNTVIRDWIDLSRQIETSENKWQEDREVLKAYRDSLKQQIEVYQSDLEAEKPFISEREAILEEKRTELSEYELANTALSEKLPALEDQAIAVVKLLPELVQKQSEVREATAKLEGQIANRSKEDFKPERDLNNRLVAVLSILRKAEKFQNKITIEAESGEKSTFDTIYFGLGQAYRIEKTGERAWIGRVVDGKFTFTPADQHAEAIRKLIAVAKEEEDAKMIAVPTQVGR